MNELALFAGAGGGILGGLLLGWRTVCAVEYDEHARNVLVARQNDGCLEPFPIWDDVRTFDGKPWRGIVDVVSGGFPCQDISNAGKRAGINGERSGLWGEMFRIVREIRPGFVFVENSSALLVRGIERVLGDMASIGYNSEYEVISACALGAPHPRERVWIVSYANEIIFGREWENKQWESRYCSWFSGENSKFIWPDDECGLDRMVNGVARQVERLERIGNGQVPAVAAKAWHVLCQRAAAGALRNKPKQHTAAANQNWRSRL